IKDTSTSHRRAMVVEVLGRDFGFLAAMSAIAGMADAVMVPESETSPEDLLELLNESYDKGTPRLTVVAAEGASPSAEEFRDFVNEAGAPTRPTSRSWATSSRAGARAPSTAYSPPDLGPPLSRRSPTGRRARW
ncbi:MAG TPA: 6-phosphofructokinase, partial [Rubrobacter sp.]|nr:6-phosphofructokinase [Rubrobacter sp.]